MWNRPTPAYEPSRIFRDEAESRASGEPAGHPGRERAASRAIAGLESQFPAYLPPLVYFYLLAAFRPQDASAGGKASWTVANPTLAAKTKTRQGWGTQYVEAVGIPGLKSETWGTSVDRLQVSLSVRDFHDGVPHCAECS
jgi:hypothetical protein